ncbi:hypothetical protein ACWIUD_00675 [Helicobacter sp. 23-1044]
MRLFSQNLMNFVLDSAFLCDSQNLPPNFAESRGLFNKSQNLLWITP